MKFTALNSFGELKLLMVLTLICGAMMFETGWVHSATTPQVGSTSHGITTTAVWSTDTPAAQLTYQPHLSSTQRTTLRPFVEIIPTQDGTGLIISLTGIEQLAEQVIANLGPSHDKGGWSPFEMIYSDTERIYQVTTVGLPPQENIAQSFSITTTSGLNSEPIRLMRGYLPPLAQRELPYNITTEDGKIVVSLVTSNTVATESYLTIAPSYALPGSLPVDYRLIGNSYSVRLAGAIGQTEAPFLVEMSYDELTLNQNNPELLAMLRWDTSAGRWQELESTHFTNQQYLSAATTQWTTYALVVKPKPTGIWQDELDDFSQLQESTNLTSQTIAGKRQLTLRGFGNQGWAITKAITPTSLMQWEYLSYSHTVAPPTTTLSIDILRVDHQPIFTNVTSGFDLSQLDPITYPALKLRAVLSTTVISQTPSLDWWQVTWQPARDTPTVYLPLIRH